MKYPYNPYTSFLHVFSLFTFFSQEHLRNPPSQFPSTLLIQPVKMKSKKSITKKKREEKKEE